jgi:RNA polymerase sigma-70 factor (ECF subfamily)
VQNQAEFATFMHAYQDMVFSTAARLTGNDAQAEDIAQEVFLKAYENFPHLKTSPTAGGWLKTVATRLTLNHLSRYRRRWRFFSELRNDSTDDESEVEFPTSDLTADSIIADIDAGQRHALVEQALRELPEHHRIPLFCITSRRCPTTTLRRNFGFRSRRSRPISSVGGLRLRRYSLGAEFLYD